MGPQREKAARSRGCVIAVHNAEGREGPDEVGVLGIVRPRFQPVDVLNRDAHDSDDARAKGLSEESSDLGPADRLDQLRVVEAGGAIRLRRWQEAGVVLEDLESVVGIDAEPLLVLSDVMDWEDEWSHLV